MALSYEEYLAKHPVSAEGRAEIDAHKARMLAEVRAYRLRELREQAGLSQARAPGIPNEATRVLADGDPA